MRRACQKAAANTYSTVISKVIGMQVGEVSCVECFLILIHAKTRLYVVFICGIAKSGSRLIAFLGKLNSVQSAGEYLILA